MIKEILLLRNLIPLVVLVILAVILIRKLIEFFISKNISAKKIIRKSDKEIKISLGKVKRPKINLPEFKFPK